MSTVTADNMNLSWAETEDNMMMSPVHHVLLTYELGVRGEGPGHGDLHDEALARLEAARARPHLVAVRGGRLHFVSDNSDRYVPHLDPGSQFSK